MRLPYRSTFPIFDRSDLLLHHPLMAGITQFRTTLPRIFHHPIHNPYRITQQTAVPWRMNRAFRHRTVDAYTFGTLNLGVKRTTNKQLIDAFPCLCTYQTDHALQG